MTLLDIIPIWTSLASAALTFLVIYLIISRGVMRTIVDPAAISLFQVTFTFFILALTGLLQVSDAIGFLLFLGIVFYYPPPRNPGKPFVTQADWVSFSKLFALVLVVANVYLISQKGIIFMSDDVSAARQEYFQGYGTFARINEIGIGLLVLTAALLWEQGRKIVSILAALLAGCASLTFGNKSALLSCLFAYGAYLHFAKRKASTQSLVAAGSLLATASLGIFYLIYGQRFLAEFAYRFLAFSDGPVYFFFDKMYKYTSFSLEAPFDILLVNLRLRAAPMDVPLGPFILLNHFNVFSLQAPNPQMFVEAHAYLHQFGILWYALAAALFVWLRRVATNPYTLYFATLLAAPFLVDSSLSISLLLTDGLLFGLLGLFLVARWILRLPAGKLIPAHRLNRAPLN
jgi:hypothetical protein